MTRPRAPAPPKTRGASARWWTGLAVTGALVGAAAWTLRPSDRTRGRAERRSEERRDVESLAHGRGGVQDADVDRVGVARVRGEVIDADGNPLSSGALSLRCLRGDRVRTLGTARINEDGHFDGPGCRGQVCATLQHASERSVEPWVLRAGENAVLRTEPRSRLWGEVVTPSGEPVEAARVTFVQAGNDRDPLALLPLATRSTTTDADGRFAVAWVRRPPCGPCDEARGGCAELPPLIEELEAWASAPSFATGRTAFERGHRSRPDSPLRIVLPIAQDLLTGRLLGTDGQPYARAYVLVRSVDRPREQRRADVGEDGNFEVDGLGDGPHTLRALQDGVELATADVEIGADVELVGTGPANGPDLELVVLGADGRFAEGAIVDGGPFRGAETDMKGKVRALAVLPGPFAVRVRHRASTDRFVVESPHIEHVEGAQPLHRVEVRMGRGEPHRLPAPGL